MNGKISKVSTMAALKTFSKKDHLWAQGGSIGGLIWMFWNGQPSMTSVILCIIIGGLIGYSSMTWARARAMEGNGGKWI